MASPQPPPGPLGNGNGGGGPAEKQVSASSRSTQAQPVVEILGGDAYAAVVVLALLVLNMTQGMDSVLYVTATNPMLLFLYFVSCFGSLVNLTLTDSSGAAYMNGCTC